MWEWIELGGFIIAGMFAGTFAYSRGVVAGKSVGRVEGITEQETRQREVFEEERLKRRNALRDRGRTTDRRPEHDGQQPSRVRRMRVIGGPTGPVDDHRTR